MKKIIVIGSGYSGSGAVFDYLAGRPDIADPFKGAEFRIIGDPGGLYELHNTIKHSFSVHNANAAIKNFIKYCKRRHKTPFKRRDTYIAMPIIENFIKNITLIKYKGLSGHEQLELSRFKMAFATISKRIAKRRGKKAMINTMYYPIEESKFLAEANKLINNLINNQPTAKSNSTHSVINHGGTFWNPETSTQYFDNRHVVVVTRDPRDIYSELKYKGNAYPVTNVKEYCVWYEDMINRISETEWNSKNVTVLKFEKFVNDFETEKNRLDKFLGLDVGIRSTYNPKHSMVNIGKYKQLLRDEEADYIKTKLSKYI